MTLTRVSYRAGQRLHAADLRQEQQYRTALRRRHNLIHHGWGIVSGLELTTGGAELRIGPGTAVDGYGRELIVEQTLIIESAVLEQLVEPDCQAVDVWLLYGRAPYTPAQRGRRECGPGQPSRWLEETRVRLAAVSAAAEIDPRRPPGVPPADLQGPIYDILEDDPRREWPVYLGRVKRPTGSVPFIAAAVTLPYAGLIGETTLAPSGLAYMQTGSERGGLGRRFAVGPDSGTEWLTVNQEGHLKISGDAVFLADNQQSSANLSLSPLKFGPADLLDAAKILRRLKDRSEPPYDYLYAQMDSGDRPKVDNYSRCEPPSADLLQALLTLFNGQLTNQALWSEPRFGGVSLRPQIREILHQCGPAASLLNRMLLEDAFPGELARRRLVTEQPPYARFDALGQAPETAAPWQVYHAVFKEENGENGKSHDELRYEIQDPGEAGNPANYRLAFGFNDGTDFHSCLTVTADCKVIIDGSLTITGQLAQGELTLDPTDPGYFDKLLEALLQGGIAGATAECLLATPQLSTTVPATVPVDGTLQYAITVRNESPCPMHFTQLRGTLSVVNAADALVYQDVNFISEDLPLLDSQADQTVGRTFDLAGSGLPAIPAGHRIIIGVLASNIGPLFNRMYNSAIDSINVV